MKVITRKLAMWLFKIAAKRGYEQAFIIFMEKDKMWCYMHPHKEIKVVRPMDIIIDHYKDKISTIVN